MFFSFQLKQTNMGQAFGFCYNSASPTVNILLCALNSSFIICHKNYYNAEIVVELGLRSFLLSVL